MPYPNTRSVVRSGSWDKAAAVLLPLGAILSGGFTLYSCHHTASAPLQMLLLLWVLSPSAGFWLARRLAQRAPAHIDNTVRAATVLIALCSTVIYAAIAFSTPGHQATFAFVVVPIACWLGSIPLLAAARLLRQR